jgi:NADPH:quinone reductase-like Zn-dependent oxidoreductase
MKAVVYQKYGPPEVLQFKEIEKPSPRENEVLIKIRATTAHVGDTKMRSLNVSPSPVKRLLARLVLGIFSPKRKILGMELAGEIEEIGNAVTKYATGDQVFASTVPGMVFSAYAEYICLPEDWVMAHKPTNMTFEETAPIPGGGITSLGVLRKADIQSGQKVLIYGASGSVGTFSVQLAKYFGAEVTGVCSASNFELVKSLGADKVIDYRTEDFTENGEVYDVIFDTVDKLSSTHAKKSLAENGVYLNVDKSSNDLKLRSEDLVYLKELCEEGKFRAVIDRTYPFEQIVEAHRYVDKGHKKGNVAITIGH